MPWTRGRLWAICSLLVIYLLGMLLLSFSQRFDNEHGLNHGFASGRRGSGGPAYDAGTRRPSLRGARLHWCAGLRYLEPPRYTVALASFPGSGNTWLRYLIQQATGIYTGSVYKDYGLLKNGFPGESVNNGSVLVVKTHEWGPVARGVYHKAVLLVRAPGPAIQAEFNRQSGGHVGFATPDRYKRAKGKCESVNNGSVLVVKTHEWGPVARGVYHKAVLLVRAPGPAIQAEFNRQSGGHVGFATPDRYKRAKGKFWQQFVHDKLAAWRQTNLDWLYNFTGPTHVLFYEKLVENVEETLKNLLDFLGYPVTPNMLSCALDRKEGIYRRRKRVLNFDPYSSAMKKTLQLEQEKVYQEIRTVLNGKLLKHHLGIFKFS